MSETLIKSPLHDWHMANGANIMWDDGFPWPMTQSDDPRKEYDAVRSGTGLLDLFSLFVYDVTGPEAGPFLQRTFTNLVETMEPGQVRYGAFVDPRGLLMDEGNIYKFSDNRYLVMANGPGLEAQLNEYGKGLRAAVANVTAETATIGVQGPTSPETLQPLVDRDLNQLKFFRFWPEEVTVAGRRGWISRTGYSGEKGYEVTVAPADALAVWEALIERGGVPFGVTAIEVLRVEAGLMLIYIDYRLNDMSPWDLSMDSCIKLHPDCVGTPALKAYGENPPRRFKTLKFKSQGLPDFHSGVMKDGEVVGLITSPTASPLLGNISLAILDTAVSADGTAVQIMADGKLIPAEVAPLGLLDPEKKKLRE